MSSHSDENNQPDTMDHQMESESRSKNSSDNREDKIEHSKLYVQFPCKLPEDAESELLKVDDRILKVSLPRQKKARFCFLYFANETDCTDVEAILRSRLVCGHQLFTNSKRKIDDPEYRQKVKLKSIERKIAKRDAKRLKKQLKQKTLILEKAKDSHSVQNLTNKIVVTGIPENVSETKIKKLFPNFVEFAFREKPRRVCFITFSSTQEATKFMRKKPTIDDVELAVRAAIKIRGKSSGDSPRVQKLEREEGCTTYNKKPKGKIN